jgi:surface antigen
MSFFLSGCMSSNFGMPGMANTDKSLKTSAVQNNYVAEPDSESDETTVRNAVSSADISKPGGVSIPWANTSTGSAGVINSITEENNGSYVCRAFTTTRHSYRGISNFGGKACLVGSGEWQMINFKEIG